MNTADALVVYQFIDQLPTNALSCFYRRCHPGTIPETNHEHSRLIAALVALTVCASRLALAEVFAFTNLNLAIPDGQPAGISDVETIASASRKSAPCRSA